MRAVRILALVAVLIVAGGARAQSAECASDWSCWLTPYNTPYDSFSLGIQVLEPGAHIRRHAHERQHEVLFCYAGEGWAEIDDQRYEMRPETTLLIGRAVQHKVQNTGPGQMRLLWMIAPAGLEDWFSAIGRPRRPGEPTPPPFESAHERG